MVRTLIRVIFMIAMMNTYLTESQNQMNHQNHNSSRHIGSSDNGNGRNFDSCDFYDCHDENTTPEIKPSHESSKS
jgi:hypothetical protein